MSRSAGTTDQSVPEGKRIELELCPVCSVEAALGFLALAEGWTKVSHCSSGGGGGEFDMLQIY